MGSRDSHRLLPHFSPPPERAVALHRSVLVAPPAALDSRAEKVIG